MLALAGPPPSDEEIRGQIQEIVSRAEFRPRSDGLATRLLQLLTEFFGWLGGLHDVSPLLFWILLCCCVVLLLLLLGHMMWMIQSVFVVERGGRADAKGAARRQRLSADYRREALRLAELGEFTEAIRHLFLSLVYRFDESGRVSFRQAYTNREYLALFADRQQIHEQLKTFVDLLDDHWYGQRPTHEGRYQECWTLYQSVA